MKGDEAAHQSSKTYVEQHRGTHSRHSSSSSSGTRNSSLSSPLVWSSHVQTSLPWKLMQEATANRTAMALMNIAKAGAYSQR